MFPHRYRYAGLSVASDLPLPEWRAFEDDERSTAPQVVFKLHEPWTGDPPPEWSAPQIAPGYVRFLTPDVACYEMTQGGAVAITPAPGARADAIRLYLLGTAWSVVCYQREMLSLHAGVVGTTGGAVAFCGPTGAGKSTVTTWLLRQGYMLLGDDLCTCELPAQEAPRVWPAAPRLKLWADSLAQFGLSPIEYQRDLLRYDKFHLPWAGQTAVSPVPLRAIYVLAWGETAVERLQGAVALTRLVQAVTYRPELLAPMGLLGWQWRRCADLVSRAQIWQFSRPRDWTGFEGAMRILAAHLASVTLPG